MKWYTVNLNESASTRWAHVIEDFKDDMREVVSYVDTLPFLVKLIGLPLIRTLFNQSSQVLHKDEMACTSRITGIPVEEVFLMQFIYELTACCTSGVINTADGVIHYRTMDWEMPELKKLTINVRFERDGEHVFNAVTWAGSVGIFTAAKSGAHTVSINFRTTGDGIMENLTRLVSGIWPPSYLLREKMSDGCSTQSIIDSLTHTPTVSPCYFIIASTVAEESVIIARSRQGADKIVRMGDQTHIVQTNVDDEDEEDSPNILYSKERICEFRRMVHDKYFEGMSDEAILKYFDVFPLTNETTLYRCVMRPGEGTITTRV